MHHINGIVTQPGMFDAHAQNAAYTLTPAHCRVCLLFCLQRNAWCKHVYRLQVGCRHSLIQGTAPCIAPMLLTHLMRRPPKPQPMSAKRTSGFSPLLVPLVLAAAPPSRAAASSEDDGKKAGKSLDLQEYMFVHAGHSCFAAGCSNAKPAGDATVTGGLEQNSAALSAAWVACV